MMKTDSPPSRRSKAGLATGKNVKPGLWVSTAAHFSCELRPDVQIAIFCDFNLPVHLCYCSSAF